MTVEQDKNGMTRGMSPKLKIDGVTRARLWWGGDHVVAVQSYKPTAAMAEGDERGRRGVLFFPCSGYRDSHLTPSVQKSDNLFLDPPNTSHQRGGPSCLLAFWVCKIRCCVISVVSSRYRWRWAWKKSKHWDEARCNIKSSKLDSKWFSYHCFNVWNVNFPFLSEIRWFIVKMV